MGLVGGGVLLGVPLAVMGVQPMVVRSGSMTPTFVAGDLLIGRTAAASSMRAGDLVTFRLAALGNRLVTHRVVSVERTGDVLAFETRGDANRVAEHWTVPENGSVGRVLFRMGGVGRIFDVLASAVVRTGLLLAGCSWVLAVMLPRIWRVSR